LAGRDLAVEHDAVDRRIDRAIGEQRLILLHLRARKSHAGDRAREIAGRRIQQLARNGIVFVQLSVALVRQGRLHQGRLRLRQTGLRLLQLRHILIGVDEGDHLALFHMDR
jgi:hypothetical protein